MKGWVLGLPAGNQGSGRSWCGVLGIKTCTCVAQFYEEALGVLLLFVYRSSRDSKGLCTWCRRFPQCTWCRLIKQPSTGFALVVPASYQAPVTEQLAYYKAGKHISPETVTHMWLLRFPGRCLPMGYGHIGMCASSNVSSEVGQSHRNCSCYSCNRCSYLLL